MKFEALDIETLWNDENIAKLYAIGFSNNKEILYSQNGSEEALLTFFLTKARSAKIYYVHNLSFEAFVFIPILKRLDINFKIFSMGGVVYNMEIYWKGRKIRLRCSYRLTLLSLDKLSGLCNMKKKTFPYAILKEGKIRKIMKIEKKDFNFEGDYEEFIKTNNHIINTDTLIEDYCKNDVMITKKSLIIFWDTLKEFGISNNGKLLTASSISIHNCFSKPRKILRKIPKDIDNLIRPFYFGGRTEVFGNLKEDEIALHFDFKGMYAQCMMEKVPCGRLIRSTEHEKIENNTKPGFYYIKFQQNMEIPILPVKKDKLYFPNGTYEGWYWFEEILLFEEMGGIVLKRIRALYTELYEEDLKDFIENNNNIRKKGGLFSTVGKNGNNTCFGRLGLNPENLLEVIFKEDEANKYISLKTINGVFVGCKKNKSYTNNVVFSASITSKARVKLYRGLLSVMKKGGRLLYSDTDSIIAAFKKEDYIKKLDIDFEEVKFDSKKKDTVIKKAVFALPKTYSLKLANGEEITKIKGFNKVCKFNKFKHYFHNHIKLETHNINFEKRNLRIMKIDLKKSVNLNSLKKRTWNHDMTETRPINLNEAWKN